MFCWTDANSSESDSSGRNAKHLNMLKLDSTKAGTYRIKKLTCELVSTSFSKKKFKNELVATLDKYPEFLAEVHI